MPETSVVDSAPKPLAQTEQQLGGSDSSLPDSGGDSQARQDYRGELQQWLQDRIRYPHRLKRRKVEGVVQVTFTIDAEGHLLEHALVKSSGVAGLDAAALQLLRDAQPYPAIPSALGLTHYEIQVPVNYSLR
ncbi:energy transducer TonB [Granulosicoccus sp. 3-233]|uniref:energy transducer TonB n=1 Tax=Granulosicoccus sp. 3-233 TaxID=3417969 RepID=UPI003D335D76